MRDTFAFSRRGPLGRGGLISFTFFDPQSRFGANINSNPK